MADAVQQFDAGVGQGGRQLIRGTRPARACPRGSASSRDRLQSQPAREAMRSSSSLGERALLGEERAPRRSVVRSARSPRPAS